jgi:hypothetical protein
MNNYPFYRIEECFLCDHTGLMKCLEKDIDKSLSQICHNILTCPICEGKGELKIYTKK